MKLSFPTFLLALNMLPPAKAQCISEDNALGKCLEPLIGDVMEESCEQCIDKAALSNAGGTCITAAMATCAAIAACNCGQGKNECFSQIETKATCELNDQRTTELGLGICPPLNCDNVNNPIPAPVAISSPPTTPASNDSIVPNPLWSATDHSFDSFDECEREDESLGTCLDPLLTDEQEDACENCVDRAAIANSRGTCAEAARNTCNALVACSSCPEDSCMGFMEAKATCELNDERTTELGLPSCPPLNCGTYGVQTALIRQEGAASSGGETSRLTLGIAVAFLASIYLMA